MDAVAQKQSIDQEKMDAFLGKVEEDLGAALSTVLVYIGERLGIYKAMSGGERFTSASLAERTGLNERYLREWLINQAAGGYLDYDPETGSYSLPAEHAVALSDETSPFYVAGGFYIVKALSAAHERILNAFKEGGGILWGEHDPDLFIGTEKFFRPAYETFLVAE